MSSVATLLILFLVITTSSGHCPELNGEGINWASAKCVEQSVKCDGKTAHESGLCRPTITSEEQSISCRKSACSYCECHQTITLCDSTLFRNLCNRDVPVQPVKARHLWQPNRRGWHRNSDAYNAVRARKNLKHETSLFIPGNDVQYARVPWRPRVAGRCWSWNVKDVIKGPWPLKPICYFFRIATTAVYKFSVIVPSHETPELLDVHTFKPNLFMRFFNATNYMVGSIDFDGGTHRTPLLLADEPYKICMLPKDSSFSFCGLYFWRLDLDKTTVTKYGIKEPLVTNIV